MKKIIGVAILAAAAVFVLAALIHQGQKQENQDPQVETQQEVALPDSGHTLKIQGSDGQITQMDLNQYLWGVVAAEMPASFHEEALKAQAVAARTYALHRGKTWLTAVTTITIGEKSANSLVSLTREQAEALLDQSLPAPCAYDPRDIGKSKSAGFSIGQR